MKINRKIAGDTILDVMAYYAQQLEQISTELDFALRKAKLHQQRIINGDNTFFEQMFYAGAYQRCTELIERYRAVDQSIRELKQSRAFVLIQTEWVD